MRTAYLSRPNLSCKLAFNIAYAESPHSDIIPLVGWSQFIPAYKSQLLHFWKICKQFVKHSNYLQLNYKSLQLKRPY